MNLPLTCVYFDELNVATTRFDTVDDYKDWKTSSFQYGVKWSYLIETKTGKTIEVDHKD